MNEKKSYILGIESAIGGGSISLQAEGVEIGGSFSEGTVSRAEELLPRIDSLLRKRGVTVRDLGVIIVSTGPGSYTGIRVGIATLMGFRASTRARCLGVTVLQAMNQLAKGSSTALTAVPMGRNMVCSQLFEGEQPRSMPNLSTTEEFIGSATTFSGSVVLHRSLFDAVNGAASGRIIDAGENLASLIAASASSRFASEDLTPLFVDRQ